MLRSVVRRHGVAVDDRAAFLTDDPVYHNAPVAPITGREAIANNFATVIRPGPLGIESIDFRVINIAADGPVVMTERVDVFRPASRCSCASTAANSAWQAPRNERYTRCSSGESHRVPVVPSCPSCT